MKLTNINKIFFIDFIINLILVLFFNCNIFMVVLTMTLPFFVSFILTYKKLSSYLELNFPEKFKKESIYLSTIDVHYLNPIEALFYNNSDHSEVKFYRFRYKNQFILSFLSFIFVIILDIIKAIKII